MKEYKVAVLSGDGIGPEIMDEAKKVLNAAGEVFDFKIEYKDELIGGIAYDNTGVPLPDETVKTSKEADAVMLGAVGDWKYDTLPPEVRPERALLGIRKALGLFANLRPAIVWDELVSSSPLKPENVSGVDIMIIRELTGDVYFGEPKGVEVRLDKDGKGTRWGFNNMIYSEDEVRRIAKIAFETAMVRGKKLCSVDKANVLDVSRLWREVVLEVAKDYPEVELSHMYVDNAAMQLIRAPKQFDTIVTGNIFGDILSDEASMLSGSLGLLQSASLGENAKTALYEPIHGSAPDLRGKDVVNPIATILSAGMMLKYSFKMDEAYDLIEKSIKDVLKDGYRTADIMSDGKELIGTKRMGDLIKDKVLKAK